MGVAGEELSGEGRTLHAFLDQVWHPAQRGAVQRLDHVDPRWHGYLRVLGEGCGLAPDELLASAPDLRIELDRELEEDELDASDWQTRNRLKDLADIRATLQDLVQRPRRRVGLAHLQGCMERTGIEPVTSGLQILSRLRQRWSARAEAGWLQQSTAAERVA
jgi:hypothetical protein